MVEFPHARSSRPIQERYTRIPLWVVRFGAIAKLKGSDVKVLHILASRADNTTHICMPSRKTIARESGVCSSSIGSITQRLALLGVIKKWRKGNRIHYLIAFKPPEYLAERENPWMGKDKLPKKSASYVRNTANGQFTTEKPHSEAAEKPLIDAADNLGDCLKSTSAVRDKVFSLPSLSDDVSG